ncbi:MAG: DUF1501 domain-containing protein, partial [Saprospiraceae bacterium]
MTKIVEDRKLQLNRRAFLSKSATGIGVAALSSLIGRCNMFERSDGGIMTEKSSLSGILDAPHFAPKAKRVIYLFQSGGPSQLELFDYKPLLNKRRGEDLPESIRKGQRLTGMTSGQSEFPLVGSLYGFSQHGQNGTYMSDLMPYTSKIVDELCIVKSMHTEAINHDPAITFFQTGS